MHRMNAYFEDLRKKIVEALRRGTTKSEAARSFGVSRSSVKRYAKLVQEGRSLAPKKRPGSKPKLDERARRLLEADLEGRPAATLSERREYLGRVAGLSVSESTVSRMVGRLGWSRKKDCEYCDHGARDVSPWQSDPKKRGLRAFPTIRRPVWRASRRRWSKSHVTS
jgi:transposase